MKRVVKNMLRGHISNHFRGREVWFRSKSSRVFDMDDEEENAEYRFWTERYGFKIFQDITDREDMKKKFGGDKYEEKGT